MQENYNKIKELRKIKNMTQEDLANYLCLDKTSISKWETYKNLPNQNIQNTLCSLFDVSLDYLLGRTDTKEQSLIVPENLDGVAMAFYNGIKDLSQEDLDAVSEYVEFIKSKKKK